jgi:hypothetical protein
MNAAHNWAARIPIADSAALWPLRLFPAVELGSTPTHVWIRGGAVGEELERALQKVPGLERFEVLAFGKLRALSERIPHGFLPGMQWQPLARALPVLLPTSALPGNALGKANLVLVRSAREFPASLLKTSLEEWLEFATAAAEIRLQRLTFAAQDSGAVFIRGAPMPPLRGEFFAEQNGIAVPCGWTWQPAVSSGVLRELFGIAQGDLIVLEQAGYMHLRPEQFVPATRSAVRSTAAEFSA